MLRRIAIAFTLVLAAFSVAAYDFGDSGFTEVGFGSSVSPSSILVDESGARLSLEAEAEPNSRRIAALRSIVAQLRSWKRLSIIELRAINSTDALEIILLPGDFSFKGVSLRMALPEGIRFTYTTSVTYDFKVLSGSKVVRLRGDYADEDGLDSAILAAYEDPASVVALDNPLYVRSRLDEANANEARQLRARPAILAALNGSTPISPKAVARLKELRMANPSLTEAEAAKSLKAAGFSLTNVEISAIFLVDLGYPR